MQKEIHLLINMEEEIARLPFGSTLSYLTNKAKEELKKEVPNLSDYRVTLEKYRANENPDNSLDVWVTFKLMKGLEEKK